MTSPVFDSAAGLLAAVGHELGHTDWMVMEQSRIDGFAEVTGDHQWIHVDPDRAAAGPFGGCIAHGYLTLALANKFLPELVRWERLRMGVNYGCDRVRFPTPVRAGARIRGHGEVVAASALPGDGVQATVRITVEIEGSDKPGCVVDTISRLYFE
ncbi:MAG: MaoC family dehydratase [Burkholderiales bacterium]|nr:MaoC family dehydratase [Burkholderiales bacterium]MDE1929762.1 MaoC family dehydratase [Burkholderiales bacterium]MDE2159035.1 MaoC family dehydratase [Burkholderiales bacterium]MDE2502050.1 MaoC family dehydratase [Burkholderiales bacterium]